MPIRRKRKITSDLTKSRGPQQLTLRPHQLMVGDVMHSKSKGALTISKIVEQPTHNRFYIKFDDRFGAYFPTNQDLAVWRSDENVT